MNEYSTPETLNDDDLIQEAAMIWQGSDAQQEAMTDDDIAWVRGIDAEVKRRGLWNQVRDRAFAHA